LCIAQHVFSFVERATAEFMPFPRVVRAELRAMAASVPVLYADLGAPLSSVVGATDAQGAGEGDHGGYGVVARQLTPDAVASLFRQGAGLGYTVSRLNGDPSGLRDPDKVRRATKPFTLLSHEHIGAPRRLDPSGPWALERR
jgi:hypothetical protein